MNDFTSYYAVIFTSQRSTKDDIEYETTAQRMIILAKDQSGFLGVESARGMDRVGITVSYWQSLESISAWRTHAEHKIAQELGRSRWYESFTTRICKVEREYSFHGASHLNQLSSKTPD
jgi:heme-degrading monooxygenase HmoA